MILKGLPSWRKKFVFNESESSLSKWLLGGFDLDDPVHFPSILSMSTASVVPSVMYYCPM